MFDNAFAVSFIHAVRIRSTSLPFNLLSPFHVLCLAQYEHQDSFQSTGSTNKSNKKNKNKNKKEQEQEQEQPQQEQQKTTENNN